ncbi:protein AF-9-like [Pollicipes pollicipes]|uniref:protein AF-9-like n=1 Tax=Pollicipes pollicipes TaxID=41117 RepID=UPI001884D26F|nr:protein AF-9-like [Pollicipes pollicipes]
MSRHREAMAYSAVQVMLELGHRAVIRDEPTAEGYTHDWAVFVRGPDQNPVEAFIDKVVFQLHESFPKPKRVKHEPPYEVCESGYAGFLLPITVHFKNKENVTFNHDLVLQNDQPTTNVRKEKLTFQNTSDDFRRLLIRGGGGRAAAGADPVLARSPAMAA